MSDGQALYLVLCLLYLSDCFEWINHGITAFTSPWGGKWRAVTACALIGDQGGRLVSGAIFPGLSRLITAQIPPVAVAPTGICSLSHPGGRSGNGALPPVLAYEDIGEVSSDGNILRVNRLEFAKFHSPALARDCAEAVRRVLNALPPKREEMARRHMAASFDQREVERLSTAGEARAAELRPWCRGFFVYVFFLSPVLVLLFGLERLIIPLGASLFLFAFYLAFRFFHSHKGLYPGGGRERAAWAFKMVVCPPSAAMASDLLVSHAVTAFHPVAVGSLLDPPAPPEVILSIVRRIRFPLGDSESGPQAAAILAWFTKTQVEYCSAIPAAKGGVTIATMADWPARESGSSHFCPRCLAQYSKALEECPDCPGVKVLVFPQPADEEDHEDL